MITSMLACTSCFTGPTILELSSKNLIGSGNRIIKNVAKIAPLYEPGRPATTIASTNIISLIVKELGSMKLR